MAHIKLYHSLVLLGILHLILILFCLVTGAPSVGTHGSPPMSSEDPTLIAPPHDAVQSSDLGPPKSRGPHSSYHLEQQTKKEDSQLSSVLKGDKITFRKDEAKVDEVSIGRLSEKSASTNDNTGPSLSDAMTEELIEQISNEQIAAEVKDINPSRVVEDNLAARDRGELAGAIPLPRTAPPLKDVIRARQKLGLELRELLNEHIEQIIDNGQQSLQVNDLSETSSLPEFSASNETPLTHQTLPSSTTADKDDLENDPKLTSEDLVKESFQDDNIIINDKPITVDKVQFVAKTKEYLYENKQPTSSGHEVEQSLPRVKVLLDTVKELPDKAVNYVVGFESSSGIVGGAKDVLATNQHTEFIFSANTGGDDSQKENLADGEMTETRLLGKVEDFEDGTRNRVARVSRVLDNAALDSHAHKPPPLPSLGPSEGFFDGQESSYNSGLLGNGSYSLHATLSDRVRWAQSHFPAAEKKVEPPFADIKTKKQTSVGGFDHQPMQGAAMAGGGGHWGTLVGLFPEERDTVNAVKDSAVDNEGAIVSGDSKDKDERDIDGRGSLKEFSSFEINNVRLLDNTKVGDVSLQEDVEALIGNHKKVIDATPTLKPVKARQTDHLDLDDVKVADKVDHVTHETIRAHKFSHDKIGPKEKHLQEDQMNGLEVNSDEPEEETGGVTGENVAGKSGKNTVDVVREDVAGTSVEDVAEEEWNKNAEQRQLIKKTASPRHRIGSREHHGVDPHQVDEADKTKVAVGGGLVNPISDLHEDDQHQTRLENLSIDEASAEDFVKTNDAPELILANELTNNTSSSAGVSDTPSDAAEGELDQKGRVATEKSSGEGDPSVVTDPSDNSTDESSPHLQEAAEDVTLPGSINGTKDQEDSIETYSQFAERVAMEKLNDGGGASGGVNGGPGGASSPTKLGPSKKYNNKNYAGTDCGSKLLSANPEAQHASKVIQSNRDEYLLNDCTGKTWFVVELCESIRPSRFEIANFELFSNLPRDISVLGSQRYPTRDWTLLGDYTGQEGVRGVQPFDIQTETFFKYIKVEINSHYGSEYYCPVSLFRVFGVSEFEVIDSLEDGADDLDDDPLEQQEEAVKGNMEDKKERSMLPTVLRSMLTNVLGVLNRGASLSISSNGNQTPPVDECTSLDPRYKIDENKCSLAPTINWHLGCYDAEYKYVLKLPIVEKTVENREFCKSLVDNLCSEKGNKEMREDDVKPGENSLNGTQVDLNFACSTRVCGNSYVCVMLCSHHLLALCHIKHYNLAANPSLSSPNDYAPSTPCSGNDSIVPKDLSTVSGIVSKDPVGQNSFPNYIIKNDSVPTEKDPEKETLLLQDNRDRDSEKKDCGKQDDPVSESSAEQENSTTDSNEPKSSNPSSSSEHNVETKDMDSKNGSSDSVKEKLVKKGKESKDTVVESKSSKDKKILDSKWTEPGSSTNGDTVNGHRNGEHNGQNGSPLPTVEQDHLPPKDSNGHAVLKESNGHGAVVTPPNKESVVVRLSNKIKVLEHNLSISSQYLEELSKRYKRQMEEMQQQFSSAVTALNRSTPSEEEVVRRRLAEERLDSLQQQMEELTKVLNRLAVDHESLATRVVEQHLLLMFAEVVLLFVAFYFCVRRQRLQPIEQQQPIQATLPPLSPSQRPAVLGPSATPSTPEGIRRGRSPLALSWQSSTENGGTHGGRGTQKYEKEDWRNIGVTAGSAEIRRGSIDSATGQKLKDNPKTKTRRGSTENLRIAGSYRSLLIDDVRAAAPETVTRRRKKKTKVAVKRSNSSLPTCGYLSSSKAPPHRGTTILKESSRNVVQFSSQQQQSPQSWTAKLESRKRQPTSSCLERFGESSKCGFSANMKVTSPFSSDVRDKFQQPWATVQSENSGHHPWHVSSSRSRSISGSSSATDGSMKFVTKGNNSRLNNSLNRLSLSKQTKAKSRNGSKESPREREKKQKLNQSSAGVLFSCERKNISKKNAETKTKYNPVVPLPTNSQAYSLSPLGDNVVARRHHSLALVPYEDRRTGEFLSLNFNVNNSGDEEYPNSSQDNSSRATPFSRRIGSVVTSNSDILAHVATSLFLNADTVNNSASTCKSINPLLHPLSGDRNNHFRKELVCYSSPALSDHSGLMRISECSESSSALTVGTDLELLSDTDSPAHTSTHQIYDGVFWGPSDQKRLRRENSCLVSPSTGGVASGDSSCFNKCFARLKLHSASDGSPRNLSRDVLSVSSDLSNVASSDSGYHPSSDGVLSTATAHASWRCNGVPVTDDNHPLFSGDQFPELPSLPTQNTKLFSSLDRREADVAITVARRGLVEVNGHSTLGLNGHKDQDHSSQPSTVYDNSESRRKIVHKRAGSDGSISYMKSSANKVNFSRGSLNGGYQDPKGNGNRKNNKKSKWNTGTQRGSYGSVDKLSTTNGGIGPSTDGVASDRNEWGQSLSSNKSKTHTNGRNTSCRSSFDGGLDDVRASTNSSFMKPFTSISASAASTSNSQEKGGGVGS